MNTTVDKWTVDAAKYFKEEVLDIMPDIPRDELSEMVGEYIYYQQADVSKNEAHRVVEETCVTKQHWWPRPGSKKKQGVDWRSFGDYCGLNWFALGTFPKGHIMELPVKSLSGRKQREKQQVTKVPSNNGEVSHVPGWDSWTNAFGKGFELYRDCQQAGAA
jgi:hypothetical protein